MYVFEQNFSPLTVAQAMEIWLKNPEQKLLWAEECCAKDDIDEWEELPPNIVEVDGDYYYSFQAVSLKDVVKRGSLPRAKITETSFLF